ncbi:MAG: hypothetical protein WAW91_03005 [Candidatus Nanoperiomorbaceae bacterium]
MKNNTTNNKSTKTNKTVAQRVNEAAHKEILLKDIDRDILTKSVLTLSLAINLATFVGVMLLMEGFRLV